MNKNPKPPSHAPRTAEFEPVTPPGVAPSAALGLLPTLAAGIAPITPPADREAGLRDRLLARVARSAQANQRFETVRLGDGVWRELAPGVSVNTQHRDAAGLSCLIRLASGASWRVGDASTLCDQGTPLGSAAHECLVVRGSVQLRTAALGSPKLGPQDYQFIGTNAPWLPDVTVAAEGGALLYWRSSPAGASEFGQTRDSHTVHADDGAWAPLRQGVKIKPLHQVGERTSMLARFEPGARVPDHPHGLDEECLMVQGDLFLGDLLLREGEFQFAPSGSDHGELFSDVGCVLFFTGAVDPNAIDPAVYAGQ
jgi:ChrR Cupin-like domain